MKVLIFSDLHIDKKSLVECSNILNEILEIAEEHDVGAIWNLGDTFDTYNPTSECLDIYAEFVFKWGKDIFNIVASSHESTELGKSIVNHFQILNGKYRIAYNEATIHNYLLGHYMLKESSFGYKQKKSAKDLSKYDYVFLGHQHTPQCINDKVMHVGSCRYVSFSEYKDDKRVLILDLETKHLEEVLLKSPTPMEVIGVSSSNMDELCSILEYLENYKIKVIFNDLKSYKNNIDFIPDWNKKFEDFKIELNFSVKTEKKIDKKVKSFDKEFIEWLDINNIDDEIKNILKKAVKDVK